MAMPLMDMVGQQFGKWTVVKYAGRRRGSTFWMCRCECGVEKELDGGSLRRGQSSSCKSCSNLKHGEAFAGHSSPEYIAWRNILARCFNRNSHNYKYYGGRGITVCERWRKSFLAFLDDVGRRPSAKHSIDRIDVNGNYEPGNVRWATVQQQANNKRPRVRVAT